MMAPALYTAFGGRMNVPPIAVGCDQCGWTRWVEFKGKLVRGPGRGFAELVMQWTPDVDHGCPKCNRDWMLG